VLSYAARAQMTGFVFDLESLITMIGKGTRVKVRELEVHVHSYH
jgi:hypothetical protein